MVEPRQHILPPHMIQARLVRLREGCSCLGTAAAPAVRGHGSLTPRLSRWRQMSPSRQPSASQRAGAGHRPPPAGRVSSLICPLLVSSPCADNRLAQVLLCTSPQDQPLRTTRRKAAAEGLIALEALRRRLCRFCLYVVVAALTHTDLVG